MEPGFYRDSSGALKREVAEFRIYGYNAQGEAVRELTMEVADIQWTVELANHKAAWYNFELALDIPEAADAPATTPRIPALKIASCPLLPIEICRSPLRYGRGISFYGQAICIGVELGELRSDAAGRLLKLAVTENRALKTIKRPPLSPITMVGTTIPVMVQ